MDHMLDKNELASIIKETIFCEKETPFSVILFKKHIFNVTILEQKSAASEVYTMLKKRKYSRSCF